MTKTTEAARGSITRMQPSVAARLQAYGIGEAQADRIAEQALGIVLRATKEPQAQWFLAPHSDAASEARWTGVVAGKLRTVQVDRVFRAGPTPQSTANDATWWIIDYKTAHEDGLDPKPHC